MKICYNKSTDYVHLFQDIHSGIYNSPDLLNFIDIGV
jgi:hypothetical protein